MLEFLYKPIKQNFSSRQGAKITHIVIHDTGNSRSGADALNHFKYFNGGYRGASAHYFVDKDRVVQIVGDSKSAWAVGDNQGYGRALNGVKNRNSISIELCINSDGDYEKAFKNVIELTKNLMKKFSIPSSNVCRHYDCSRKVCPGSMAKNNWARWREFKREIEKPIEIIIDTNKDSKSVGIKQMDDYFEAHDLKIIKTSADSIYIQQLGGKTLREAGVYGINGTFFNMDNAEDPKSTWGIAINNGRPIGPNSHLNHPKRHIRRATLVYDGSRVVNVHLNNIADFQGKVIWAIGGVGLIPSWDPKYENVPVDILRKTMHTGMAFKGKSVYLIVSSNQCTLFEFKKRINNLNMDGAIALDGGGSTQMYYKNNFGVHSGRKLNNIIGIKM